MAGARRADRLISAAMASDLTDEEEAAAAPRSAGGKNYMTPAGHARLRGGVARSAAGGAAEGGGDRVVGGRQRRPVGERRLPLRQEAAARDRPPHPLPRQAAGDRRGGGPGATGEPRPRVLRRHRYVRRSSATRSGPSPSSASTRPTSSAARSACTRRSRGRCCGRAWATW